MDSSTTEEVLTEATRVNNENTSSMRRVLKVGCLVPSFLKNPLEQALVPVVQVNCVVSGFPDGAIRSGMSNDLKW